MTDDQFKINQNYQLADDEMYALTRCPWCKSGSAIVKNDVFRCPRCSYECDISNPPEIRVIGWTTPKNNDYLDCECFTQGIFDAIVKDVREKGYSFSWLHHIIDDLPCTPVINNGYKIYLGPRTLGSIMATAHDTDEVEYSLGIVKDPVFPPNSVDYRAIIPFEIDEGD